MPPASLKNTEISRRAGFSSLFGGALGTQPAIGSRAALCGVPFLRLARSLALAAVADPRQRGNRQAKP